MQANQRIVRILSVVCLFSFAYANGSNGPKEQPVYQKCAVGSLCKGEISKDCVMQAAVALLVLKQVNDLTNGTGYAGDFLNWLGKSVGFLSADYFNGTKVDPTSTEGRLQALENVTTVTTPAGSVVTIGFTGKK